MNFWSARLLYRILVDDGRPRRRHTCDETVVVFRARDFDDAFRRALELGRAREARYRNDLGQLVRWSLASVDALGYVGPTVDGAEVASRRHTCTAPRLIPPRTRFQPERSQPESMSPAGNLPRQPRARRRGSPTRRPGRGTRS